VTAAGARLRIGTRGSALALAQSRWTAGELARLLGYEPELVIVKTSGDRFQAQALASFGGAGAFTMEIDSAQREGRFEISVHSLKDLPTKGREGLALAAVPKRAPVEDCLVSKNGEKLDALPRGAAVASGSARRTAQLLRLRPDLTLTGLRGNVDTRIRKVRQGEAAATLLAHAGLTRLSLTHEIAEVFDVARMVPAAGQGALALVASESAPHAIEALRALDDSATHAEVDAEREVLAALGGGCHLPLGVLGRVAGARISLVARVTSADGRRTIEDREEGDAGDAAAAGRRLGARLVAAGARELIPGA
jgi:hydroxymethylbilane synthase